MYLLAIAARTLPIGTAYAVWVGIGATGTAILGMVLFSEPANATRIACLGLIIAGVLGLRLLEGG
jgi:quaternary ammonium compound-resistance protein SugE